MVLLLGDDKSGQWLEERFGETWIDVENSKSKKEAGKGDVYHSDVEAFIQPQPFPSWTLDLENQEWTAPVPRPDGDSLYYWNEKKGDWQKLEF